LKEKIFLRGLLKGGGDCKLDYYAELKESGAVEEGHFRLSSGRHSDTYVQCARFLEDPEAAVEAGAALAGMAGEGADAVLCPALGGVVIGFTTALALGVPMMFAERDGGELRLRRGFEIEPGSRVLLVEDVVTTGGSIMELASLAEGSGAQVAGIACIVDRGGLSDGEHEVVSLVRVDARSYEPDDCPLCESGEPVVSPGSRYSS
jgi:orotate phosphoribosyltransferase